MTLFLFFKIFFACLLGAMSPGPSMIIVINNGLFRGRRNGIYTSVGHGIGIGIYAIFAILGIGLFLNTNYLLHNTLKILSIFYLIYLGIKSFTSNQKLAFIKQDSKTPNHSFFEGFSIAMLNPKILIWFLAIYSQFINENNDFIFNILLVLIASFVDMGWYILLSFLVTSAKFLNFLKLHHNNISKIIGFMFITIAMILLLDII